MNVIKCNLCSFSHFYCFPITLSIQISILCLAVCILHPTETQSPSHIQNTKDTPTITSLRNYNYVIPRTKRRLERSTAPYSSYTAAPRRTAPGPSNLCPSYLTTLVTIHSSYGCLVEKIYVKDRCDELERSASHFRGTLRVRGRFFSLESAQIYEAKGLNAHIMRMRTAN